VSGYERRSRKSDYARCIARYWDPNYYRTYNEKEGEESGYRSVEMEVIRALERREDFVDVPKSFPNYFRKMSNMVRDSIDDDTPAWVVRDAITLQHGGQGMPTPSQAV
jgi:hypothetical protein